MHGCHLIITDSCSPEKGESGPDRCGDANGEWAHKGRLQQTTDPTGSRP